MSSTKSGRATKRKLVADRFAEDRYAEDRSPFSL